jgi:hypothetical protein
MKRMWRWSLAGFVTGGLVGVALLAINIVGTASGGAGALRADAGRLDILHTPPLLVSAGEPASLTYETVCSPTGQETAASCSPTGTLHVRAAGDRTFTDVPLVRLQNGKFSYAVPTPLRRGSGFEYYVTFQDGRGNGATVPAAGADAPERVWIVPSWTTVDLGIHGFGSTRAPDSVLVKSPWGTSENELGLNNGREQSRIGPSSFDVAADGSVIVLDQVNHRLAHYGSGKVEHFPIEFRGGEGDVALGNDGTAWVLDAGGPQGHVADVRGYDAAGHLVGRAGLAAPMGEMLRTGPNGPLVHSYPSEMWLPVATGRTGHTAAQQVNGARAGRPVVGGRELVVRASPEEARFALVAGKNVISAWRVVSRTNLGEVQLAEPTGNGVTAIVRLWTEDQAEFGVLQLGPTGLTGSFAVSPAEWAESAPLSRFRLRGNTLYQLRSSPEAAEVVAYRMGGAR